MSCKEKILKIEKRRWRDSVAYLAKNHRHEWRHVVMAGKYTKIHVRMRIYPATRLNKKYYRHRLCNGLLGHRLRFAFTWDRWRWPRPD